MPDLRGSWIGEALKAESISCLREMRDRLTVGSAHFFGVGPETLAWFGVNLDVGEEENIVTSDISKVY